MMGNVERLVSEAAQFWMNTLPGCLTYGDNKPEKSDEQLTFSVRLTVYRSRMLLEYPSVNISPLVTADSSLQADLQFYRYCRRIDLSRAAVRIMPEAAAENATALQREQLSPKHPIIIEMAASISDPDAEDAEMGQLVLFARGRREKEIILRVLEDAVNFYVDELRDKMEGKASMTALTS
jgi:hypothetical protein